MAYIGNYPAETQTVDLKWQSVKTASFTAVAGEGYWINTTTNVIKYYDGSAWSPVEAVDTSNLATNGFAIAMAIAL